MKADLEEALVPLQWAEAQIQTFRERFAAWQRSRPYELVMEPNPNAPEIQFLVAYRRKPLDPLMIGDAGAIINSIRAALDVLWMLILRRHGFEPGRDMAFPVKRNAAEFEAAAEALKSKYRCSDGELSAVKRTRAYRGGNDFLYPLHQLAIQPRHYRLLIVKPAVDRAQIEKLEGAFLYPTPLNAQEKSILAGIPARARFRPSYGNVLLGSEAFLDEPALLKAETTANLALVRFAGTVREIVESFP
ncbi:MAG TPA: hypothetical protein VKR31_07105 [Rhizomicrobium sp.]|nr:hypothetical protein [Rhizomicrobium sp.]